MSIATKLTKLETDITSAYASIQTKGGTIPNNKNTENLSGAISSIEVVELQTAEGESLSLSNTKAMPYKDFVIKGKSVQTENPNPTNLCEISSVADGGTLTIKQIGNNLSDDYVLQIEPLRSLPNGVKDIIDTQIHKKVISLVFDGSSDEDWRQSGQGTNTDRYSINVSSFNVKSSAVGYCNRNEFVTSGVSVDRELCGIVSGTLYFRINKNVLNEFSVATFKNWLSTHPIEIITEIGTEETISINQKTLLEIIKNGSYEGTTNINTDGAVKPTINLKYYKKS